MEVESVSHPPESKRKLKKLYIKIREQMEFYFSDSNLVKDKFLTDLISKDPDGFVDIEVFKTFNKIKALTKSTEMIATSVSRSRLFELNQDQTRLKRTNPVDLSKNFDACTLYVEKLPQNADQKWIKDVFGHFGIVKYVNIPRYKITNNIKGFAFIEFDDPNGVQKACEFYKTANEKECSASEDESKHPKNAKKNKNDDVHDKNKKGKRNRARAASESSEKLNDSSFSKSNHSQDAPGKDNGYGGDRHHQKNKRKRKREDSGGEKTLKKLKESVATVKVKSENEVASDINITTINSENEAASDINITTIKSENEVVTKEDETMNVEQEQQQADHNRSKNLSNEHNNVMEIEEKQKRRRKNPKKHHSNTERPLLRVMPKSEWKAFRNKYLDLQRSTMSLLKKQILLETQEFKELESNTKAVDVPEHKKSLQFRPGVIIKIELNNPVKNTSDIKNEVKANAVVAYVDAPEKSSEIFIRCHTPEEAKVIIKEKKLNHFGKTELLKDAAEKRYWEKIENDRKLTFSNHVPHKKRGREKLLAKAAKLEEMKNKHIYFEE